MVDTDPEDFRVLDPRGGWRDCAGGCGAAVDAFAGIDTCAECLRRV